MSKKEGSEESATKAKGYNEIALNFKKELQGYVKMLEQYLEQRESRKPKASKIMTFTVGELRSKTKLSYDEAQTIVSKLFMHGHVKSLPEDSKRFEIVYDKKEIVDGINATSAKLEIEIRNLQLKINEYVVCREVLTELTEIIKKEK